MYVVFKKTFTKLNPAAFRGFICFILLFLTSTARCCQTNIEWKNFKEQLCILISYSALNAA